MNIIPVIDLKKGRAVHAKQGQREAYQPLQSLLSPHSDIDSVLACFLKLHTFKRFYIADLDAIMQCGSHTGLLTNVLKAYPTIEFLIDSGYPLNFDPYRQLPNYLPVLGSESFSDANVNEIEHFQRPFVLSLDYSSTGELGSNALFGNSHWWPDEVIIMTLSKVGGNLGPDFEKLYRFTQQYPHKQFIAAGGVRDNNDLISLEQIGVHTALVATALHNGNIASEEILHWK